MNAPLAPGDSGGPIIDGQWASHWCHQLYPRRQQRQTRTSYAVPVTDGDDLITALRTGKKRDTPVVGMVLDSPPQRPD